MGVCAFSERLSVFHDGEVDEAGRMEMQAHLRDCLSCAAELGRLQAMSGMVSSAPVVRLSQIGLHRLHRRVDAAMEELGEDGVLRYVRVFNAIAACVLVAGSAWLLMKTREGRAVEIAPAAPPWVDVAEASDTPSGAYSTPAAAWYLADDSGRAEEAP